MRPQKQKFRHRPDEGEWGDCHRTALASIMGLDRDEVPHFGEGGPDPQEFSRRVAVWLLSRGVVAVSTLYDGGDLDRVLHTVGAVNRNVYYLLGGGR
jgi:hypothetical protein